MSFTKQWIPIYILMLLIGMGRSVWGLTPAQRAELAYQEGQRQELAREFQKAAEYYLEAVQQDKKNAQYQYKLAYVYTQLKPPKTEEAIALLKRLVKSHPKHKAAYVLLGRLYLQQGGIEKAEAAFERALEIDGQFAEPHFFLGGIWMQRANLTPGASPTKRGEQDEENMQRAISHYQAYLRLATRGEYLDTAQERLRELLYGEAGVRLNLAIAAMRHREYDRALMIFNRLLQDASAIRQQEVHYWRGLLYSIPEAYPHYDKTGTKSKREWLIAPDILAARVELGNWYYQIGDVQSAIEQLETAVRLWETSTPNTENPRTPQLVEGKALSTPAPPKEGKFGHPTFRKPSGRGAQPLPYGKWLIQRAYFYLGKAYMQANQSEKALKAFQKVQSIDPEGEFAPEAKALGELLSGKTPDLTQTPEAPLWNPEQGAELKNRFLREYGEAVFDATKKQRLESILTRILTASSLPFGSYPHSIVILDNPAANAWGLPGGQIFVSTGLLRFVATQLGDSDDVLAFIIAHEIAHLENHDIERSQEGIQVIKGAFAGGKLPLTVFQHGLSRVAELRADKDGALLAYRAKFDPTAAIRWCEAVIATDGDIDPNGDHPTFKERKELLKWYLTAEVQVAYGKFRAGVDAFNKGDYITAIENFLGYLAYFPHDKYALNNLGVVYHQHAIHKAASSPHGEWRLAMGVEVQPGLPPLRIRGNPPQEPLDEALLRKAIQQFEAALRVDRRYKVAYKNLGDVYGDLGEFAQANEAYQQALRIDPKYAEAKNNFGVLLCRLPVRIRTQTGQKQFEDGIQAFQQVLRIDKNNLEARYNLALAYEYTAQPEKARNAWQEYLRFDDKSDWADRARGHLGK